MNEVDFGTQFRTVQTGGLTATYSAGNTSSIELPRTLFHKNLTVRLSGSVTVATAVVTAWQSEAPLGLIKRIDLVGDGVKTLFSVTGRDAFRLCQILTGKHPEFVPPTALAVATYPFSASFTLHNEAVRMGKPVDSYLDPRGFEKLELRIQWGQISDICTVGGATVTISGSTGIDINICQTADGDEHIGFRRLLTYDETTVTGANTNLPINVPRIGYLAGILVHAEVDGTPNDSLVNYISLRSDNVNIHIDRLAWETARRRNIHDFSIDSMSAAGVTQAMGNGGINGYVYIDLTEDGMLGSALNTYGLNTLQLVYDVNNTGTTKFLRHTYVFYEPINVG